MCLQNYNYAVLNNAFLIHKAGIKKAKVQLQKFSNMVRETNTLIKNVIQDEISVLYGRREGCFLR